MAKLAGRGSTKRDGNVATSAAYSTAELRQRQIQRLTEARETAADVNAGIRRLIEFTRTSDPNVKGVPSTELPREMTALAVKAVGLMAWSLDDAVVEAGGVPWKTLAEERRRTWEKEQAESNTPEAMQKRALAGALAALQSLIDGKTTSRLPEYCLAMLAEAMIARGIVTPRRLREAGLAPDRSIVQSARRNR